MRWSDGKSITKLELHMVAILQNIGLTTNMVREYRFHPVRRWRLDFAWPDRKVGIETHGAIWKGTKGGHTSGTGRLRDMEKRNEAMLLGWQVLEIGQEHINNGQAEQWARQLLS